MTFVVLLRLLLARRLANVKYPLGSKSMFKKKIARHALTLSPLYSSYVVMQDGESGLVLGQLMI